ncbi:acyltransferase family protein [Lacticaseibacillus rhamnosus]|uniref:acyltransferase family protein n=1 Tax=Lacticaseibacillus rhamnosus TaxID=47715 RepID=UPI0008C80423|nr:acyltransferase [Lacticaseibacillus rhamnosus]MDK7183977.1 acyltransferase [Lacticaseibacillus rhamnosus]MDK7240548.1 acyltransferase [Lacticaseibacillus rhamnosus]MDT8863165.1 acyltransferase [Lacticaseibacillus rhamnosus]OFN13029.1 hypothetical protein HMPREF2621_00455 [Lactobacillus sp. HMSC072E07]
MLKRLWWVDLAKGWTILLVVVAHSIQGIDKTGEYANFSSISRFVMFLAFTVVMPVFFALSGFVYRTINAKTDIIYSIRTKFLNLGVPYVVFSIIYVVLQHFSTKVNTLYTGKDLLFIFANPIGYLWFLYALFLIFLVVYSFDFFHVPITAQLFVSIFLFMIGQFISLPHFFSLTFTWLICFEIGRLLKTHSRLYIDKNLLLIFAFLFITLLVLQYMQGGLWYDTNVISLKNAGSKLLSIPVMFGIFYYAKHSKINDYFARYGKYSLVIYMVHAPAASVFHVLLTKIYITNYFLLVILTISLSWLASVIAVKLAGKSTIIAAIFFPSRTIKSFTNPV